MKAQFASACLLIVLSAAASALPITLQSTWNIAGPNVNPGLYTLLFTYDDTTPDSNPDAQFGNYADPLLALTLYSPDALYSLNSHEENSIGLRVHPPLGGYNYFHLTAGLVSNAGELLDLDIYMEAIDVLINDSLENFKNDARRSNLDDNLLKIITPEGTDIAHGRVATQFTEVPEPGLVSLSLAGLFGVVMLRRSQNQVSASSTRFDFSLSHSEFVFWPCNRKIQALHRLAKQTPVTMRGGYPTTG